MAIDKNTQRIVSFVIDIDKHELLKELSKKEKRSVSSQLAFLVDEYIESKTDKAN